MADSQTSSETPSNALEELDERLTESREAVAHRHRRLLGTLRKAARETQKATRDYVGFWAHEGARWQSFAEGKRRAVSAPALKRVVLKGVRSALDSLQGEVDRRIAALDQPTLPGPSPEPAAEAEGDAVAPLRNYDAMNARMIVSALKKLDDETCREVERYEAANKNRSTVLRAVRRRLAA